MNCFSGILFVVVTFTINFTSGSHHLPSSNNNKVASHYAPFKTNPHLANDWSDVGRLMEDVMWSSKRLSIIRYLDLILEDESGIFNVSSACSSALHKLSDGLKIKALWSMHMLDATPTGDAGYLSRWVEMGDYDQCLEVTSPDRTFSGQHCMYKIQFALPPEEMKAIINRVDLRGTDMSNTWLEKTTHYYKYLYFDQLTSSLCFPSTCSRIEMQNILNKIIEEVAPMKVAFYPACSTREAGKSFHQHPTYQKIAMTVLGILTFLTFGSRLLLRLSPSFLIPVLVHFDISNNSSKLFSESSDEVSKKLSWVNGARFVYLLLAIGFHVGIGGGIWTPATHAKYTHTLPVGFPLLDEFAANMSIGISINFVLGGMLAYVSWVPDLIKFKGKINFWKFVLARWFRTFPLVAGVILIILSVPESFGSGPVWKHGYARITNNCLNNWWYEFLYVSNYLDFRDSCIIHAWYLGADFQLYIGSFFIIGLLHRTPRKGMYIICVMICASILFQGFYLHHYNLNPVCDYNTTDFDNLFKKDTVLHTRAFNYIPSYLIGIWLGYLVVNNIRIPNHFMKTIGWFIFIAIGILVHAIPLMWKSSPHERPARHWELLFGSLQRAMYSIAFGYGFWNGSFGESGFVNSMLECAFFRPLGRASSSIFIGHFLVIWYDVFTSRSHLEFRVFSIFSRLIYTTVLAIFIGYFIYIVFEAPFISFGKAIFVKKVTLKETVEEDLKMKTTKME